MSWILLAIAGIFEIGWAIGLKYAAGFTRLGPALLTALCMVISVALLGVVLRSLPLGTAYAIWTGIGTVGTALLGIILFSEPLDPWRLLCVAMIVGGIVGLKLLAGGHA